MTPGLRKLALTAHVTASVGWLGAAVAYLGLVLAAVATDDDNLVRAAYVAIEPITWYAIVPLAVASLVSGVVLALGTQWGLFRHYWVVFKLVLSVVGATVLVLNTRTVVALADVAAATAAPGRASLDGQVLHAAGGVVLLLATTTLAVYKPRGLTRYGRRNERAATAS